MNDNFIVPKLRDDIDIEFFSEKNEELALLIDRTGYATEALVIPSSLVKILDLIDGNHSFKDFQRSIKAHLNADIEPHFLIEILNELNDKCYLESPNYFFAKYQIDYYKTLAIRPPVCEGLSYPSNAGELEIEIERILSSIDNKGIKQSANSIIVPHIDFNIGKKSHEAYSSAYYSIKNTDADLFVIFGTSHYGNSGLFMLTEKDFQTALGIAKTDTDILNDLKENLNENYIIDEIAHRYEHSIELQVVLLQYLFKDRDFTILPIITGTFQNFIYKKTQPNKDNEFFNFIHELNSSIKSRNKKAMFIASADLAHIGRKFQDNFDAEPALEQLKLEDEALINHLINSDSESFFSAISKDNDKRRICGTAPIYALLETLKAEVRSQKTEDRIQELEVRRQESENGKFPFVGELLKYHQWNEVETRSAVSFASIAYYNSC